jgi:hypothetical protein
VGRFDARGYKVFSKRYKRIQNPHKGPGGSVKDQNSNITNALKKHHHCIELSDNFPMAQKLLETEFI